MIEVIPDNEKELHTQGIGCQCMPKIIITEDEIIILHKELKMSELYWVAVN